METIRGVCYLQRAIDHVGCDVRTFMVGVEVNGIPGWRGLQKATSIDVAGAIVDYLLGRVAPR